MTAIIKSDKMQEGLPDSSDENQVSQVGIKAKLLKYIE